MRHYVRTSNRIASTLAALALGGVLSAQAQGRDTTRQQAGMHQMAGMGQAGGQQAMGDMQGMCSVMNAMHEGPAAALAHGEHLSLTAAQRTRLEAAKARVEQAHNAAMEQMRAADRELAAAAGAARVNEGALRNAFRRQADAHAQAAAAMLRGRTEVRETLTEQQRTQLAQLSPSMGGMAMGGQRSGPMMRDSMVRMTPRRPMMGDSARTMPQGQRMMGDSAAQGGMGHMGMMGMMMSHCSGMRTTDTTGAHRH